MLEEQDPTAMALLEVYKLPMPNLSLNQQDVDALLEYFEAESRIVEAKASSHASHDHAEGDHH